MIPRLTAICGHARTDIRGQKKYAGVMCQPINNQEKARPGSGAGKAIEREVFALIPKRAMGEERTRMSGSRLVAQWFGQAILRVRVQVRPQLVRRHLELNRLTKRHYPLARHALRIPKAYSLPSNAKNAPNHLSAAGAFY